MRWLFIKDLQILKRSPLLTALLAIYPIAIALMIGFALSSPPGKPKVAYYSAVPAGKGQISFGNQKIDISSYAKELFQSIQPIKVSSRDQAIAKVRNGDALAALIIPSDIVSQIESLITTGVGSPSVDVVLNTKDPLERQFVDQAITSRLSQVEQAVSKEVLSVAVADLGKVLNGGTLEFLGQKIPLLGLRNSRTIIQGSIASLPPHSSLRVALRQVVSFFDLAIGGLGFATPVLGSIGNPLTRQPDPALGQDDPHRSVRDRDRGDRLADVRHAPARLRDARARAFGERLRAPGARIDLEDRPAVREDHPVGGLCGAGHAGHGRVHIAVRPPGLGTVRAVGARAGARGASRSARSA